MLGFWFYTHKHPHMKKDQNGVVPSFYLSCVRISACVCVCIFTFQNKNLVHTAQSSSVWFSTVFVIRLNANLLQKLQHVRCIQMNVVCVNEALSHKPRKWIQPIECCQIMHDFGIHSNWTSFRWRVCAVNFKSNKFNNEQMTLE